MTHQEIKFDGYILIIRDKGFYLEDEDGKLLIDATLLGSSWPVEINIDKGDRDFYINTDPKKNDVSFGFGQRGSK